MKPLFFLLLLLSIGCVKKEAPTSGKEPQQLNLNFTQDIITLDPRKGSDFVSSTVHMLLFEGLTRMTPYSLVAPALAEKIDVSPDMTLYTFHLRDSKWSNGTPITAYDFAETFRDMLDPSFPCPNAHLLYPIKNAEKAKRGEIAKRQVGIRAIDHKTLEIELECPTPFFLEIVSFCIFCPINQHIALRNPNWADDDPSQFVSNGPYTLVKWKRNNEIVLKKNPYYWDAGNVMLDEIHISIVDNEMTAMKMYELGELDLLGTPFTGIPSDSVSSLMEKGLIHTAPLPAATICCFNMNRYPFNNLNIRKAFAFAINRKEIVDNITQLNESIGPNLIPKILMNSERPPFFRDGDVESAKYYLQKGLKELGITEEDLGPIKFLHASTGIYPKIAEALQEQWRKALGIYVQLESYEYKVFLDKLGKRDFQLAECIWIAQYHDPMNFFDRFKSPANVKNYCGFYNARYNEILEASLYIKDKGERFKCLEEAEQIFNDEMPLTALYHWNNVYIQKTHVTNLHPYPTGSFYLSEVSLKK